jgi:hypothetical protein
MNRTSRPDSRDKFEKLVSRGDPLTTLLAAIGGIRRPLGTPVRTSPPPSFAQLQEIPDRQFRRGKIGAWRDEMPPGRVELFWQGHGEAMHGMGYAADALEAPACGHITLPAGRRPALWGTLYLP